MKIVLAPDKFKHCLTAPQVCSVLQEAFRSVYPEAEIISCPMSDGGDGLILSLSGVLDGHLCSLTVSSPVRQPVNASFFVCPSSKTAVIEMASASGLALLSPDQYDPLHNTTYGTGELIRAALDAGADKIILGIGGSAANDGGAGMAQALGFRLLDREGNDLPCGCAPLSELAYIDASHADSRLAKTLFIAACDVDNPLLGENGASRVFAPQKGASPSDIPLLEAALSNLAAVWRRQSMLSPAEMPGDGAAGGLGAGLRAFCHARFRSGADLVMELVGFREILSGADLVVTGEGCTDEQTFHGKLCSRVAEAAQRENIPVMLLSGAVDAPQELLDRYFACVRRVSPRDIPLADALGNAENNLYHAAVSAAAAFPFRQSS